MRKSLVAAVFVMSVCLPATLFGQTGNGQVGGIVEDASRALVPGVTITLTNTGTGISSTQITNEAGAYNFSSVPPGTYSVTASLAGFKTTVTNGVQVTIVPVRVNFTLEVGALESTVDITATSDTALAETSASVGVVLAERRVSELPLVGNNVLDLLSVLPGFRTSPVADAQSTVGGLNLDYVNTTINGLSTVSSRDSASFWGRQVMTTNVINPDLVGEIRLVLSPVDAELGRGNSQVQITTRSGTNRYAGSVVWNVGNSALNANTWANKRTPTPTQPDWYNLNQVTASFGGPIIRNKTFFFALYDKQNVNRRSLVTTPVLTETARQGIWRYWEGWNPGPALAPQPTSFVAPGAQPTGVAPAVDFDGNPIPPLFNPTGGPYTLGGLRCFSVFGNKKLAPNGQLVDFTSNDCPGGTAVINSGPWDPLRTSVDSTGLMLKILNLMPNPNFFGSDSTTGSPDGLNIAQYRWVQRRTGSSSTNASIGVVANTNDYNNRDQINLKFDHNLTESHRLSVSWTYEKDAGEGAIAAWDGVLKGNISRRPQFLTVNATSTLSPTLVNEARFGLNYSSEFANPAWANIDRPDIREAAQQWILYGGTNPENGKRYPVLYNPGANWNGYLNFGSFDFSNYSPLYNVADTIRWTRGRHSFSFGGEYRRPYTIGYNNSAYVNVNPGNAGGAVTPLFFTNTNVTNGSALLPGFLATSRNNAGDLLSRFYGAINNPNTAFWIDGQPDLLAGRWQDVTTAENRILSADPYGHQTRTQISNEWSFFAKDDFKLNRRLTINLGVRYDFTGSPYFSKGLTNRIDGDGPGLFGASRVPGADPFSTWLSPGNLYLTGYGSNAANPLQCVKGAANPAGIPASNCDPNLMSKVIFVGPETDHPDQTLVPQSGRFSPAIGFSWQVPWFGDRTTLRGGFQRTYGQAGSPFTGGLLSGPGADGTTAGINTSDPQWTSIFSTRAANLTDLALAVPATPTRRPQEQVFLVGGRRIGLTYAHYDPDYSIPYTDNITLTIQHSLRRNMTLEIRAVNTLARNQHGRGGSFGSAGTFDLNTVNVYHNPELFNALEVTRAGGNHPLFDEMLMGLNLNTTVAGYGAVGTCVTQPAGSTHPDLGVGCPQPNQVLQRGSAHLRRATAFSGDLANGSYAGVASSLLTQSPTGLQTLPIDPATGVTLVASQRMLRNGCDRLANGQTGGFVNPDTGVPIAPRCFPENYLVTNPQFTALQYAKNLGYSDYNSVEIQYTLRPTHGMSVMATYGFSKTMTQPGNGFTDPLRPELDYSESIQSVGSDFRANGTVELPVGPDKLFFGNTSGWVARLIERWQMGFIYNWSSGAPRSFLTGFNMLYANGRPNIVGPWTNPKGSVEWDGQNGSYFREDYDTYVDPQCAGVTTRDNLQTNCTLRGLALVVPEGTPGSIPLSAGKFGIPLLENPAPGQQGNLGATTLSTFGRWTMDASISKAFQIDESKSVQLRIDAKNIFNHPTPTDPTGLANQGSSFNDNFGQITNKTGSREFQARLRVNF